MTSKWQPIHENNTDLHNLSWKNIPIQYIQSCSFVYNDFTIVKSCIREK